MKKTMIVLGMLAALSATTGCVRSLSGDTYTREEAQRTITFREGTVLEVRKVRLEGTNSGIGTGTGAVLGGVAGSGVGQGRGAIVGAVVGAVVGGIAGAASEEGFTRSDAWELTVRMSSGESIIVVQEVGKDKFSIGDRVRVSQVGGKSRVSPATGTAPAQNSSLAPATPAATPTKGSTSL